MKNIMKHIAQGVRQYKWLLLGLCAIVIFNKAFVQLITKYICPITSGVAENSWLVLVVELLAVAIVYVAMIPQIKKEREIWVSRCWVMVILLFGYIWFRIDKRFVFIGFDGCVIKYADWVCLVVVLTEAGLLIRRKVFAKKLKEKRETVREDQCPYEEIAFREETPTERDRMLRESYAKQLVNKIAAERGEQRKGALTILLNEHYGVGKTSFMLQVQQKAKDRGVDVCWFKPWMYDNTKAMILNFIHVLEETIGADDKPLQQLFNHYAKALSAIEKFEWMSVFQSEDTSVESQFEEIKNKLQEIGQPIIVLIDDVDRLQSDELLRMLQVVRNIGDFPHINYVIAADKSALINRLAQASVAEPEVYLKKFFNLEISFPADDHQLYDIFNEELSRLLQTYSIPSTEVLTFVNELKHKSEIFANLREVKRYVNLLDYTLSIIRLKKMQQDMSIRDVAGICLIQQMDSALYHVLRDHRDYILEISQRGMLHLKKDYTQYFANREDVKKLNEWIKQQEKENRRTTGKEEKSTNKTMDVPVHSIDEVLAESKPLHIEIMGSILDILFSDSLSDSKIGVKYETEYFKYFAFRYQDEGMSNQDFVNLMVWKLNAYSTGVNKVVEKKRIPAFRQKMQWFIQNENYERLDVLKRIIIAAKKDYKQSDEDAVVFKLAEQDYFTIHYGSIVLSLFRQRKDEGDRYKEEWKVLRKWFVNDKDYYYRAYVLGILNSDIPYDDFIFGNKNELKQCVGESVVDFVDRQWGKDIYNENKYKALELYRRIYNTSIDSRIIDRIAAIQEKEAFWMHLVQPGGDRLEWNNELINAVLDGPRGFEYNKAEWEACIPQKWRDELFYKLAMDKDITSAMIQKSVYLQDAMKWWEEKEKENGCENK